MPTKDNLSDCVAQKLFKILKKLPGKNVIFGGVTLRVFPSSFWLLLVTKILEIAEEKNTHKKKLPREKVALKSADRCFQF